MDFTTNTGQKHGISTRQNPKQRTALPKVSPMSIKWHPQAPPLVITWTKQHIDAYLTNTEVVLEQNVDPGKISFPF
jgi:hypothetical protein